MLGLILHEVDAATPVWPPPDADDAADCLCCWCSYRAVSGIKAGCAVGFNGTPACGSLSSNTCKGRNRGLGTEAAPSAAAAVQVPGAPSANA